MAHRVGVLLLTRLQVCGVITLLVDDTLAHQRGNSVGGLGWVRDAVASTKKRVATASGHNGVVLAVAVCVPLTKVPILALPLLARLHRPGQGPPRCADLTRPMLGAVLTCWPQRRFPLVGDGAYATKGLLLDLDERLTFVGRLRGEAALYDPRRPPAKKGQRGQKAKKGPQLPQPKEAAAKADRKRQGVGDGVWQDIDVAVYGCTRTLFAGRWALEVLLRASKQVMDIEAPQHWSPGSVAKLAPWVWSMPSVVRVWYITAGYESAEAEAMRGRMGDWDSEWSMRPMIQVLRRAIRNATIDPNSANEVELRAMTQTLKNWANLAA